MYQFYSNHTLTFQTDQNSLYLNPRWNNFIDILDFPKGMPIKRVIRHVLFGPLEDRAVPYLGLLGGATLPGPGAAQLDISSEVRWVSNFQSHEASQSTPRFNMCNTELIFRAMPDKHSNG